MQDIVIDKQKMLEKPEPHEHLVISPYPKKYESLWKLRDGRTVLLRPIKPEDEPLWLEMFKNFSEESIRYRFFNIIKDGLHKVVSLSTYQCNLCALTYGTIRMKDEWKIYIENLRCRQHFCIVTNFLGN